MIALVSGNAEFALGTFSVGQHHERGQRRPSCDSRGSRRRAARRHGSRVTARSIPVRCGRRTVEGCSTSPVAAARAMFYRVALDRRGQRRGRTAAHYPPGSGRTRSRYRRMAGCWCISVFRLMANIWSVTASPNGGPPVAEATPIHAWRAVGGGPRALERRPVAHVRFRSQSASPHLHRPRGRRRCEADHEQRRGRVHAALVARRAADRVPAFTPEGARSSRGSVADGGASSAGDPGATQPASAGWSPDGARRSCSTPA
jgi:hypothetical protein